MKVLVFDPNVAFARQAVDFIGENVRDASAALASNLFILRKRLRDEEWDFVLADVAAAGSMAAVLNELSQLSCPVIMWSTLNGELTSNSDCSVKFKFSKKPRTMGEISSVIRTLVEPGTVYSRRRDHSRAV
jgi:hypothetical protein